jgi:phosphate-selective porin
LTGESRPYDQENGEFKRLIPRRNFNFGKGGAWGAFEKSPPAGRNTDLDGTDRFTGAPRTGKLGTAPPAL